MTTYEFNKAAYSSLPNISQKEFSDAKVLIEKYLEGKPSRYYMVLNNESHYYTLYTFTKNFSFSVMAEEILSVMETLGDIKAIHETEDKEAIEFWIINEDECKVYYLFDYSKGVIEIE